ncbi:M16 family metallopeptidase [Lentisalinibacter salinarum]|uniref:M16 family metallopeptidase n=1 Tax=Lentisalinibacter salinarum TaxID=2992239 RepID=UPI003870044A
MKKWGLLTLAVWLCFGCQASVDVETSESAAAQGPAPVNAAETGDDDRIFDRPYLMRDLENGLRVIIVPTDYPDVVSLQIPVQTGSRNEVEPGKSGFAHFFEHMMFRGTERFPAESYQEILKSAGADQNAYTTDDYTNYHVTFTKQDLETLIELEADRFRNLSYSEADFRTEALAVKGEYLKNYSNPTQKFYERTRALAFQRHTYRHTTMGFFEDIEMMPEQKEYADLFFDRWYRPEKTSIILVGDLDPDATFELVEKYWGGWERGDYQAEIPVEPPLDGPLYEHITWEAQTQPWLVMSFRGPAFVPTEKDMPALDLASMLYFSESSDLYQQLVIEDQVVDEFWTYFPDRRDPNLLMIAARLTDESHAAAVRDAIADTLARARSRTPSAEEVDEAKSRLRYSFASGMDDSEGIASILASYVQFERTPETINKTFRTYASLQPEDVRCMADRYFTDANRVLVTLASDASLPGIDGSFSVDERAAAMAQAEAPPVSLLERRSETSPLVDVSFLFATGAADDPPGKKGLAALTAAMLADGGSRSRTIQEINRAMYPMAAGLQAQVDKEMVRLAGTVHREKLDDWYELASAQVLQPGFRESDLERLRTRAINAIRTGLVGNNDEELGKELLYAEIYGPEHPYGSLNQGDISDIESITLQDVRAFYRDHYTVANLTVGLAGGYPEDFAARVSDDMARLPAGEPDAVEVAAAPARDDRRAVIVQKETPAVAVSFGFPIDVRRGDPDWVALWLVRSWLGEHRSVYSHLYQRIREARGMNYGDYAYIEYFPRGMFQFQPDANLGRQQQIFQVWIRPLRDNNDALFATRTALWEMDRLIEQGMSETDFEATREFLGKYVALLARNQSRRLGYALDSRYYGIDEFSDYVRRGLAELTLDDVNRVIREHLSTDDVQFVFVSADAAGLAEAIAANAPSPMTYNSEKPEGLLAEDEMIEALPLGMKAEDIRIIDASEVFE